VEPDLRAGWLETQREKRARRSRSTQDNFLSPLSLTNQLRFLLLRLREQQRGIQAEMFFGELAVVGALTEEALDHAHLRIEIIDLGDKDGLRRGGDYCSAPLEFALVAENNVLEAL